MPTAGAREKGEQQRALRGGSEKARRADRRGTARSKGRAEQECQRAPPQAGWGAAWGVHTGEPTAAAQGTFLLKVQVAAGPRRKTTLDETFTLLSFPETANQVSHVLAC